MSDFTFPPWIHVSDSLPDYDVEVLTFDGNYYNVAARYATDKSGEKWRLAGRGDEATTQLTPICWMSFAWFKEAADAFEKIAAINPNEFGQREGAYFAARDIALSALGRQP